MGRDCCPEKYVEMTANMEGHASRLGIQAMESHDEIFNHLYKADAISLQAYIKEPETFKWAFITDRIKLLLLRDFGGVYIDVDAKYVKAF